MEDYCPISKECNHYEQDSITCTFLYGLCRHKKHYEKMKIFWEEKRRIDDLAERLIKLSGQMK
jgi:hypothetical protein